MDVMHARASRCSAELFSVSLALLTTLSSELFCEGGMESHDSWPTHAMGRQGFAHYYALQTTSEAWQNEANQKRLGTGKTLNLLPSAAGLAQSLHNA
eukprot:542623-Pelagomonas_calceolata.AAC.2